MRESGGGGKGKEGEEKSTNNPATGECIYNGIFLKRNCK